MALRRLWSLGRASVCRNAFPASGIHVGALEMQPTKAPLTDEERKLLEKLGEPDGETRRVLNELYAEFDVVAEKKREQRQEKKRIKEEKDDEEDKPQPSSALGANGMFSRGFHTSAACPTDADSVSPSRKGSTRAFEDESRIIWDSQEMLDYYPQTERQSITRGIEVPHGERGVFDIEVLVDLVRKEKLQDIAVIEVAPEIPYADYLVIGTTLSTRQGKAISSFIKKLYKETKYPKDPMLKIEGENCSEWKLIDFGNIVLHLFDAPTREKYDLESLWTVGHEFDELTTGLKEENEAQDVLGQHMAFVRSLSMKTDSVS